MKVDTVGGGPGGLYASLLLKAANPEWEVTVYERNPADETYGWGIVFPNRALPKLAEADPVSHERITDAFYRWEPMDVYVNERQYRCDGHAFASLLRTDLLSILQERCREVGVELEFETEIEDVERRRRDADLVIGADGIGSDIRERYADAFEPTLVEGTDRFAWFGTEKEFPALTHTFDENEDGVWRIHAYPGQVSTFIVDCDAETWDNAGFAGMSESEYLAYLEEVFSGYLDGHDILSKEDRWRQFLTVSNETWYHDNVVLLGDAAHTAHFSIGSGTRLAMGDAIALANAFEEHGPDLDAALSAYEREQKPFVETLQVAAERSRIHYEHSRRYLRLPERQFTFHHLTRSGRVTYESLQRRDPEYIAAFTRWFADQYGHGAEGGDPAPPLAQPLDLGGVQFRNRLVLSGPTAGATDGTPDAAHLDQFVARGTSGAGLLLSGPLAVTSGGRPRSDAPGLYTDEHTDAWTTALDQIRSSGDDTATLTGAYLTHAGGDGRDGAPTASTVGERQRDRIREAFVAATERVAVADFDVLAVDAGHRSVLGAFLSPRTNDRGDAFGGRLNDRLRYPLSVIEAVRSAWSGPLCVAVPGIDRADIRHDIANPERAGDYGPEQAYEVAEAVGNAGADLVIAVAPEADRSTPTDPFDVNIYADWIRNETGIPTMATGELTTADALNTLIGAGRADLAAVDPSGMADLDWESTAGDVDLQTELL